jgi:hypothetical protein
MADQTYDSVAVRVKRDEEQGMYVLGVVVEGAFVSFAAVKLGHVDELVERERERVAQESQSSDSEQ